MDAVAQEKPIVDPRYYDEAVRWETSENSAIRLSRNAWRTISIIIGLALVAALGALWALVPLKSVEVVTLLVDKTTGFVEVAQPLERGGELSQKESVLRANVVRFIRARETYDPKGDCAIILTWRPCSRPAWRPRTSKATSPTAILRTS